MFPSVPDLSGQGLIYSEYLKIWNYLFQCAATLAKEIKREYGIERHQLTDFDEVVENEVKVMFDKLLEHPAR